MYAKQIVYSSIIVRNYVNDNDIKHINIEHDALTFITTAKNLVFVD